MSDGDTGENSVYSPALEGNYLGLSINYKHPVAVL